jgi:hypothetical protein
MSIAFTHALATHDTNWKYKKKWEVNQLKDNIRGGCNYIWEGACGQH